MDREIWLSLLSGIIGAILGGLFQYAFHRGSEKRKEINEYKKLFYGELIALQEKTNSLLNNPEDYNHIVFNHLLAEKRSLLSYFDPLLSRKKDHNRLKAVKTEFEERKESFSLDPKFESALNVGGKDDEKKSFLIEMGVMVKKAHREIAPIGTRD